MKCAAVLFLIAINVMASLSGAQITSDKFITLASTTSTEQSGLFKHLLPIFERQAGFKVRVVALGVWAAEGIEAKLSDGEASLVALSSSYPVYGRRK